MIKTTVYFPEPLKRRLGSLAKSTGRSEAELIREAVGRLFGGKAEPRPCLPLFSSGDPTLAERVDEALSRFGE